MTPEETTRLARVEVEMAGVKDWLKSIDGKVDDLRDQANLGKGALMLLMKIGAVIGGLAVATAWVVDRLPHVR